MLRIIAISSISALFVLACTTTSPQPEAPDASVPAEPELGPTAEPEVQPTAEPEASPEPSGEPAPSAEPSAGPTCADLGGTCVALVAEVACAERPAASGCGPQQGCCVMQPRPSSCHWKVGNDCFDSAELACKAAGCTLAKCIQSKSLPVQVSCSR
jgi:hypothetical protein